jgi:hypothetical protein
VLVSTVDRGIHTHGPVDLPVRVGLRQQPGQDLVPGAIPGIPAVPLPDRALRPEVLDRQVTPRDPGPIPVDDPLDDASVVPERMPAPARVRRQQRLDPFPLLIGQRLVSRRRHAQSLPRASPPIWGRTPWLEAHHPSHLLSDILDRRQASDVASLRKVVTFPIEG